MNTKVLDVLNLSGGYEVNFGGRKIYVRAVDDATFTVNSNEIIGIAGESGCGKSTLIKLIYGFNQPPLTIKGGKILLKLQNNDIVDILTVDREYLRKKIWWKEISYIPQNSMNVLDPTKRIKDQFKELFKYHDVNIDSKEMTNFITGYLNELGLPIDVINSYPHQLSGGMKQRIVIALSLALKPRIVLADEPTTAVDVVTQLAILSLLKKWQKENKTTLIIVSHDMGVHAYMANTIFIMYAGQVIEGGHKEDVYKSPKHPYTAGLIKSIIRKGEKEMKIGLPGQPPDLINPPPGCRFHPRCPYAMDICRHETPPTLLINSGFVRCWLYARK
uniref:ABC transporter ATP-binding protein n=1 Tax=Ignisphaera aggregans TaxID=334771 RepID=A0A7C4NJ90_9CREN